MNKRLAYGVLISLAVLLVAFAPLPAAAGKHPETRLVHIEAGQFSYSPSVVTVNPGETVTIELASTDVVHGLYIDGYGLSVEADPGQPKTLTFIADRSGSFRFRCNVTCGAMHPFMVGKLNVGENSTLIRSISFLLIGMVGVALFRKSSPGNGMAS